MSGIALELDNTTSVTPDAVVALADWLFDQRYITGRGDVHLSFERFQLPLVPVYALLAATALRAVAGLLRARGAPAWTAPAPWRRPGRRTDLRAETPCPPR